MLSTSVHQSFLNRSTPTVLLEIAIYEKTIPVKDIVVNKEQTSILCEQGCKNYGAKWCCPPYSPSFSVLSKNFTEMTVFCYKLPLSAWPHLHPFRAQKAANAVLKAELEKKLRSVDPISAIPLGSGACRACKPCAKIRGVPCLKPERRLYSLEATGVNVDRLIITSFGFPLQWYKRDNVAPEYTCVVGGLLQL